MEKVPSEAVVVWTGSVETIPPPPESVQTPPAPQFSSCNRTIAPAIGLPCESITVPATVVASAGSAESAALNAVIPSLARNLLFIGPLSLVLCPWPLTTDQ